MQPIGIVKEVRCGKAKAFARGSRSAIDKQPQGGAVAVGQAGLAGDEVGDARVHGGVDKAVHCYALAHYAAWQQLLPRAAIPLQAGAFGENFCIEGLDEDAVCLGDEWRVGSAVFAVSQGRQPCWKLNERFGVADMALRVQDSLRCGWYLRVLETGAVQAGDTVYLLKRPYPDWPLARLLRLIAGGDCRPEVMQAVLALPLPPSWRKLFARRLETGVVEAWQPRLFGQVGA